MVVTNTTATGIASTDILRVHSPNHSPPRWQNIGWRDAQRGVLLPVCENGYDEISPNLHEGVFRVRCTVSIGLFTF